MPFWLKSEKRFQKWMRICLILGSSVTALFFVGCGGGGGGGGGGDVPTGYSNQSLSGTWIAIMETIGNDIPGVYFETDGAGSITSFGAFNQASNAGEYTVLHDGQLSMHFYTTHETPVFEGHLISNTQGQGFMDDTIECTIVKVVDLSALSGEWVGELSDLNTSTTYDLSITVNANGVITSVQAYGDLEPPFSGKMFAAEGWATAFLTTNTAGAYNQISIFGELTNGQIINGIYNTDSGSGIIGPAYFVRQ